MMFVLNVLCGVDEFGFGFVCVDDVFGFFY